MRIALFSDVHANLPALEACLVSIDKDSPDVVYCLGDLVGYNIWPNEVIHEVRKRNIPVIFGNYDQGIGLKSDECGCAYKTDEDKAMGKISIAFTNEIIGDEERKFLRELPAHIRIEFKEDNLQKDLLLVHGSPRKVNEYLFEDRDERSMVRIMEDAGTHIMCFGHTHKPYHRILKGRNGESLHAINIGSVGKPKDNDPRGCYVILDLVNGELPGVSFRRFEYDIEKAACAIESSKLPDAYAEMLRKGF